MRPRPRARPPARRGAGGSPGALEIEALIAALGLSPHPEGGFYRETYRAGLSLAPGALPGGFGGARAASTAIYYLLRHGEFSALHRIASDEVWHHYRGAALTVHVLHPGGHHEALRLGTDLARGERPQAVVPAGSWFGARLEGTPPARGRRAAAGAASAGAFALVGCTVAPGFDFAEFELGGRAALTAAFPGHAALITALTRA